MLMAFLVLVQSASTPVTDDAPHPVFDRIAETIVAAAPRAGDPGPDSWYSVGIRTRWIRWHLAEPDDGDGWYRRSGWISEDGLQAGVAACGPVDGVAMMSFQISGESAGPLVDALSSRGSVMRLAREGALILEFVPRGGTQSGIGVVVSTQCTPEGSAAARSCRTHVMAVLMPAHEDRSCTAP